MLGEFGIIERYFTHPAKGALLGVGDDAALLDVTPGRALAVSADMLVAGTHFFADDDPELIGHKALAVNLSDMAAMGASPRWATLSLSLPAVDEGWLARFSAGFMRLASEYEVDLVGGDTTRGPLNISVSIIGEVDARLALRRDRAECGDEIWVSGTLGDAALALFHRQDKIALLAKEFAACLPSLQQPEPRVALGKSLLGVAHAAIDISDGLCADLGHIAEKSRLAALVDMRDLPQSEAMKNHRNHPAAMEALLAGGDDYELCFTAPESAKEKITAIGQALGIRLTRIGWLEAGEGVTLLDGNERIASGGGYEHFRN